MLKQPLANIGQPEILTALHQRRLQFIFQPGDGLAHRRLTDMQAHLPRV